MVEPTNPLPRPDLARATRITVVVLLAFAIVGVVALYVLFAWSGAGVKFLAAIVAVASLVAAVVVALLAPWRAVSTERLEQLRDAASSDSVVADALSAWARSGQALRMADYSAAMDLYWRRERNRDTRASREAERRRRSALYDHLRRGWPRF